MRWFSRGGVLTRLFELKDEVFEFLNDNVKIKKCIHFLTDEEWLCRLAYLSDIFLKLNELNLCLDGGQLNIFMANDKNQSLYKENRFVVLILILQHFPL